MRDLILILIVASCVQCVRAQQNIMRCIDIFRNRPEVEGTVSSNAYSAINGRMDAHYEVFSFTMPKARKQQLQLVEDAFVTDMKVAYTSEQGVSGTPRYYNPRGTYSVCALNVDDNNSIPIGLKKGNNYYYACFFDPEDSTRTHRYAYFLEYGVKGNEISGRVGMTYSTTAQYRKAQKNRSVHTASNVGNGASSAVISNGLEGEFQLALQILQSIGAGAEDAKEVSPEEQWLAEFALKVKWLRQNLDDDTATQYAASIYGLCKRSQCLDAEERKLATSELNKLLKMVKEDTVITLLKASIERLASSPGSKDGSCNGCISNGIMYFLS